MIKMLYRIEKQRIRAQVQRRHALSGAFAALLFTMLCSAGYLVMQNAQADAENSYWERNGNADVIAIFADDSEETNALKAGADSFACVYLGTVEVEINSKDKGSATAAYGSITSLDEMFKLGVSKSVSGMDLIVNQEFLDHFACSVGDVVTLRGFNYRVGALSPKLSSLFGGTKEPLMVVNDTSSMTNASSTIIFANFSHSRVDVEKVIQTLDDEGVSYINLREGVDAIEKEFSNLSSVLAILLVVVALIYIMLNYTLRLAEIKTEAIYWKSMRTVGMARHAMFGSMLFEAALFSCLGGIAGCISGSGVSWVLCAFTNTSFTVMALSPMVCALMVVVVMAISSISTLVLVFRIRDSTPLNDFALNGYKYRSRKTRFRFLKLIVGVVLVVAIGLLALWYTPAGKMIAVTYYAVLFGASLISLILLSSACSEIARVFFTRSRSKSIRLAAYTSRIGGTSMSKIAISLALCLSIAGMLLNFTHSFQSWARDLADSQLSLDMRAEAENTSIGQESIRTLLSDDTLTARSVYYIAIGSVGTTPAYIMAEAPESNGLLNELYASDTSFYHLVSGNVVLTKHMLSTLGLGVGDCVSVVLGGKEVSLTIVSTIETQDYSSSFAVVSFNQYPTELYDKLCMNAAFTSDVQSILSFKDRVSPSVVTLSSKSDLSSQWQSTIVSGVELLIAATALILIVLLILLGNSISNSLRERKRDFAILRTMGMSGHGVICMLFAEFVTWQIPSACLALILTPIISATFLKLTALMSGYSVHFEMDYLGCIGLLAVTLGIMAALSMSLFIKQKNESPIDALIAY